MLIVGLNKIRDLHAVGITSAWLGTDGTLPVESQTGLQTAIYGSVQGVTITTSQQTNLVEYTCNSAIATSNTFREFSTMYSGAGITTIEYNRRTFTGLLHEDNDDIVVKQLFYYMNL